MNILILDSTRANLFVVLKKDGCIYQKKGGDGNTKHMSLLFPLIDEVLKEAETDISDIDCFAGVTGPGSYTGIRIGVCALNAMAKALKRKLLPLDSLEALASGVAAGSLFLIDGGHDYYALEIDNGEKKYSVMDRETAKGFKNRTVRDENLYDADTLAALAERKAGEGLFVEVLIPFYMKKSQAARTLGLSDVGV